VRVGRGGSGTQDVEVEVLGGCTWKYLSPRSGGRFRFEVGVPLQADGVCSRSPVLELYF
jgi:hypothetical protein